MTDLDISSISRIYQASHDNFVLYHPIDYPAFEAFSRSLSGLQTKLKEQGDEDEYWSHILQRLVGFRTSISIAPYCGSDIVEGAIKALEWLEKHLREVELSYPNIIEQSSSVLAALRGLSMDGSEAMLESIVDLVSHTALHTGVVLIRAKHVAMTQALLAERAPKSFYQVIDHNELRSSKFYDRLIIIGPPYRFPDFVFNASRSNESHVVNYQWVSNSIRRQVGFNHPLNPIRLPREYENNTSEEQAFDLNLPTTDFSKIANLVQSDDAEHESQELEEARIYLLDGNAATLLPNDPDAQIAIIDLAENDENRIRYVKLKYLEPGMFLLLRTEGGGDFLVPIANRIMGEHADSARNMQIEWKRRLRHRLLEIGVEKTLSELTRNGSKRATYANLLRWVSMRSIKTHDPEDFRAVLRYVGLDSEFELFWATMTQIVDAHRKAGFYIRQLLLKQVMESDLSELNREGIMRFDLGDADAGSLTAFRLLSISGETVQVVTWRIGEIFQTEEESWL